MSIDYNYLKPPEDASKNTWVGKYLGFDLLNIIRELNCEI